MTPHFKKTKSEVDKAIDAGFTEIFVFVEGFVSNGATAYLIKDVNKLPVPDPTNLVTVYRIETPAGLKGYVIEVWEDQEQETFT